MSVAYIELNEFVKAKLPEKRYNHSLGVVEMSIELADRFGLSVQDAASIGIFHDAYRYDCLLASAGQRESRSFLKRIRSRCSCMGRLPQFILMRLRDLFRLSGRQLCGIIRLGMSRWVYMELWYI